MNSRIKRIALMVVFFFIPIILYKFIWSLTGPDTVSHLAFNFWIQASVEDELNLLRIQFIQFFFGYGLPFLLGVTGLFWGRLWLSKRNREKSDH